ncbi:MAG TPA: hypothetical protein VKX28_12525 [Xanthobacteraceae bacterium]|nr:hypothetical protein [Xanthobacteraceae bacterium]
MEVVAITLAEVVAIAAVHVVAIASAHVVAIAGAGHAIVAIALAKVIAIMAGREARGAGMSGHVPVLLHHMSGRDAGAIARCLCLHGRRARQETRGRREYEEIPVHLMFLSSVAEPGVVHSARSIHVTNAAIRRTFLTQAHRPGRYGSTCNQSAKRCLPRNGRRHSSQGHERRCTPRRNRSGCLLLPAR